MSHHLRLSSPFASPFSMAQTLNNTVALLPVERWKKVGGIMWTIFSPLLQSTRCRLKFRFYYHSWSEIQLMRLFGFVSSEAANSNKDRARYEQQSLGHNLYLWCSQGSTTWPPDLGSTKPGNALSTPKGSALVASSANTPTVKLSSLANLKIWCSSKSSAPYAILLSELGLSCVEGLYMMAENVCSPGAGAGFYACWCCWWGLCRWCYL